MRISVTIKLKSWSSTFERPRAHRTQFPRASHGAENLHATRCGCPVRRQLPIPKVLRLCSYGRKLQLKTCSLVHLAGNANRPAVLVHEPLANGESQTRSLPGSTESWIENLCDDAFGHPAARVSNSDHRAIELGLDFVPERDRDASTRLGVSDCVAEDIQDDLTDGIFVAQY